MEQSEVTERVYEVPGRLMGAIVNVLNQLPYQQVAPILNPLGNLINQQNQRMEQSAKEVTPKVIPTSKKEGAKGKT